MGKSILVIDDERSVRDAFELALMDTDFEVRTAEDGELGLKMLAEQRPDLVFLDLKMPGLNGVETMRQIKQTDPTIPVYIVTAFQKEFMAELTSASDDGLEFEVAAKPLNAQQIRAISAAKLG